jgi:hypothetical protein
MRAGGAKNVATKDPAESLGEAFASLLQLVFSLTFPILLITLCAISFVLAALFGMPEFGLWAYLAELAIGWATTNIWVAIGLGVFCLAAIPLTWVAFREQELKVSSTILAYVIAGLVIAFLFWLRTVWPVERMWELWAYGIIMLAGWSAVIEAALGTIGIITHVRRNRPKPVEPPRQQPHGAARAEPRSSRDEPETI